MKQILLLILALAIVVPLETDAHSGRTNAEGCHTDSKTGNYHCHSTSAAKTTTKTIARDQARTEAKTDRDCADFSTQAEAQNFYERNGGSLIDPHDLDRDKDGIACEAIAG